VGKAIAAEFLAARSNFVIPAQFPVIPAQAGTALE